MAEWRLVVCGRACADKTKAAILARQAAKRKEAGGQQYWRDKATEYYHRHREVVLKRAKEFYREHGSEIRLRRRLARALKRPAAAAA